MFPFCVGNKEKLFHFDEFSFISIFHPQNIKLLTNVKELKGQD